MLFNSVSRKLLAAILAAALLVLTGCAQTEPKQTESTRQQIEQTEAQIPQQTESTQQTEGPAVPGLNTKLLDLAARPLEEVEAVLGEYTQSNEFYLFDGGAVGYVFAYGTDVGNNYISAPLSRLIENCPETLTVEQLQAFLPDGYREFDEMDECYCYCWDYRGCTVVLFENADGTYTPDSMFFYNCHTMVQQPDPRVNEDIFTILGKTKSQMDTFFGQVGTYDAEFGCMPYTYQDSFVWAYMDNYQSGTCIGFYCPLKNVLKMSGALSGEELKQIMGDPYQDPWNGEAIYSTMYRGGQLRVFQEYDAQPGSFSGESSVNFRLAGKQLYEADTDYWTNSSSLFYGQVTVYAHSATELECAIEYSQLTPPNRMAETGTIKLTSTDGITYTATGVEDNWGSTLTVTVTMLEEAARFSFEITKVGEMANFCFGDFVAYQ